MGATAAAEQIVVSRNDIRMLCEISEAGGSLFITWLGMSVLETIFLFLTSTPVFYYYYWGDQVTYEKWRYKSNPKFPSPQKVRDEIVQMMKGMLCATVCPAISLELARQGLSQAFCGWGGRSFFSFFFGCFLVIVVVFYSSVFIAFFCLFTWR